MKNGTICITKKGIPLVYLNKNLYDMTGQNIISFSSYNNNYETQVSDLNIVEMIYEGETIYKKSLLTDTEKNIVRQLQNIGMVCLARDNDESLYAYPTDTISKKYSDWFVKDLTSYPIEYIRVNDGLFKMITSKDICPTSLIELEEVHNDDL